MREKLSLIVGFIWRVAFLFIPLFSEITLAYATTKQVQVNALSNEAIRLMASLYSDLIVIISCIFLCIAGSIVGYFYPVPEYGAKPLPKPLKLLISMTGGILAFIYYIHSKQVITPAVILWVTCVSFVSPSILHLIHAAAIKFTGLRLGVDDSDLAKIKNSFEKEEKEQP